MSYERKYEKVDLDHTELSVEFHDDPWEDAIQHVTMGVRVEPIFVPRPRVDDNGVPLTAEELTGDNLQIAEYVTDTGRDGQFFMVMVDRHNTGEYMSLTPCSDYYAAIPPAEIYRSLRTMLEGSDATPVYVYNSYNGGQQLLRVEIRGLKDITVENLPGIKMELVMKTSLDKSSNHSISIRPVTEDGVPILFSDTRGHGYNFQVRHTTGARAEIVNFNTAVASIAQNWNEKIVPFVKFIGGDFDEKDVSALMENILDDAALPKDVETEIRSAFKTKAVYTTEANGSEAMRVIKTVCAVVDDRDVTPMAKQRDADKVSKAITKNVKRLFQKYGEKI